ncbi:MAG TPA: glutamate-5-semialdehyde dehydrogenase [Candidatus Copromonas avistercoris]|nr:glutamate-5-semialdehyde dehydrogenase [Candidatus Copromonas avistercoris]
MDISETKNTKAVLRKEMKERLKGLSEGGKRELDKALCRRLLSLPEFSAPCTVYAYASLSWEPDTWEILKALLSRGFRLALPRVEGREMRFYFVPDLKELSQSSMKIWEPKADAVPADDPEALVLVPGMAFSREGARLGKGGGFYDRFLAAEPDHKTIALAYGFQLMEQIPTGVYDRPVDQIVTENERIFPRDGEKKEELAMLLKEMGQRAKEASYFLGSMGMELKNQGLAAAADELIRRQEEILKANEADIARAKEKGMAPGLVDRLTLTPERIQGIVEGIQQVIGLEDPIGEVLSMKKRPNGLLIGQKRVPLGVIGMIYEARPNVTADAFALCFKTGNAVILRGGSDAAESNRAIVAAIRAGLASLNIPEDAVQLLDDPSRETAREFMRLNEYLNVLIPRGGAGLIRSVLENSTVPVIETGTGNCHIYVDESADLNMALEILFNAKTQRIGVCNACESLLVHRSVAKEFLPMAKKRLDEKQVEIRADEASRAIVPAFMEASEEDWGTEYLDYILSCKIVDSVDEAIAHINRYSTGHSEAIITSSYENAQKFLDQVDSAAVYVNASTRFTDGFEFGFGAEIGISTQKLHARGPMGLLALTSTKYIIYGSGQIRK